MHKNDAARIIKAVEDKEGNLVLAIKKFNWMNCLFHSFYGFLFVLFFTATIVFFIYGYLIWALALVMMCLFFWVMTWLNSNDKLKERIYPEMLENHLLKKVVIKTPFISKCFNSHKETIECITESGEKKEYKVEFMQEHRLLYVVKICEKLNNASHS